jgi:hypothetical protein
MLRRREWVEELRDEIWFHYLLVKSRARMLKAWLTKPRSDAIKLTFSFLVVFLVFFIILFV